MRIERTEVLWIEHRSDYTADEVASLSGLSPDVVEALVDCGALPTTDAATESAAFTTESLVLARAALRLQAHFELDEHGLAVAVSLMRRVRALEARVAALRAQSHDPD